MSLDTFVAEPIPHRQMSRRHWRLFSIIFTVLAFLGTGVYVLHAWDQAANGIETDAVVLARHPVKNAVDLTVRFTTADGQSVAAKLTEYSDPEAHSVGAAMRVRYTPDDHATYQAEEPPFRVPAVIGAGLALVVSIGMLVYFWGFAPPDRNRRMPALVTVTDRRSLVRSGRHTPRRRDLTDV
jgi:hypothetical protein